MIQVYHWAL